MKIQISEKKRIADTLVVWPEPNEDVDLAVDPRDYRGLPFKKGSLSVIYAFSILGITKQTGVKKLLKSMFECLKKEGQLYIIEHDFEYINRALMGGDLSIDEFNKTLTRKTYFDQNLLIELLEETGFPRKEQRIWYNEGIKFEKKHYELIISGIKPKK